MGRARGPRDDIRLFRETKRAREPFLSNAYALSLALWLRPADTKQSTITVSSSSPREPKGETIAEFASSDGRTRRVLLTEPVRRAYRFAPDGRTVTYTVCRWKTPTGCWRGDEETRDARECEIACQTVPLVV